MGAKRIRQGGFSRSLSAQTFTSCVKIVKNYNWQLNANLHGGHVGLMSSSSCRISYSFGCLKDHGAQQSLATESAIKTVQLLKVNRFTQ